VRRSSSMQAGVALTAALSSSDPVPAPVPLAVPKECLGLGRRTQAIRARP
jgi:hypothetical protein